MHAPASYTDSFFIDQDLDPNLENDPVNLRLSLSNADRSWEVALWGRNMLDEEYYSVGIDDPTIGGYAGVVAAARSLWYYPATEQLSPHTSP